MPKLEKVDLEGDGLEAEIEKGIQSGPPIGVNGAYWKKLRKRLHSEYVQRVRKATRR